MSKLNIGAIPHDWSWSYFGDVCEWSRYGVNATSSDDGKYPMLRMSNMQDGKIDSSDLVYIQLSDDEYELHRLREGEILVNRTNSYDLVGKTALVEHHVDFVCASYIVRFDLKRDLVEPRFVNYFLNSTLGQRNMRVLATKGVSQANINPTTLKETLALPLPPLAEQRKIAQILSTWDEAIALVEALIAALKRRKQGLMQRLLTGEVRFPGFADEWQEVRLGEVVRTYSGGTPSRAKAEYYGGEVPWIKSGEINQVHIYRTEETITDEGLRNSSARVVEEDTLLLALYGATAGKLGIAHIRAAINQALLAIIPGERVSSGYLFYELEHRMTQILSKLQGGQPNLSAELVKSSYISLPSRLEQESIAEMLVGFDDQILDYVKYVDSLREQKRGLMQRLLTGEVRVRTTEEG